MFLLSFTCLPVIDLPAVRSAHHNKREKLSSLLFDVAKYLLTVIGVGAILPESKIGGWTALVGFLLAVALVIVALVVTPEVKE